MAIADEIGLFPEIPGISWERSVSHSEKVAVYSYNVYAYWFQLLKFSSKDDNGDGDGHENEIQVSETMQIFVRDVLSFHLAPLFQIATHDIELTNDGDGGRENNRTPRDREGNSNASDDDEEEEEGEEEEGEEEEEEDEEEESQRTTKEETEAFLMSIPISLTYTDFCRMGLRDCVRGCFERSKSHSDPFNQKFFARVTKGEPLAASKILTKKRKKTKEKEKEVADRNLNLASGSGASALASAPGVANASHVPGSGTAGFLPDGTSGVLLPDGTGGILSPLTQSQSSSTRYDNQSLILLHQSQVDGGAFSTTSNASFSQGSNAVEINSSQDRSQEARRMKQILERVKLHHEQLLRDMECHNDLPDTIVQQITAIGSYLNLQAYRGINK